MEAASDPAVMARVEALLGENGMAHARVPLDAACGLPNAAYCSPEWLALEQERLFQRGWVFAGAEAEIAAPGAIKPIEIGGAPLVLLRDRDGTLRAFHNVCRHRGARLITTPCRKSSITCPYHAWNYALDGRLRARPHFFGPDQIDRLNNGGGEQLDLIPVRVESWNGCLFVNLSGKAEPVTQWLAPLMVRTAASDFSSLRWAGKLEFDVASNWKLVYENYMGGYHVFKVHPRLLKFAPMNLRWSGEWTEQVFYNDYQFEEIEAGRGAGLPHYPDLPPSETKRGLWFLCFPHFAAEVFPDQLAVLVSYLTAPNHCHEELHLFLIGDAA